MSSTDAGRVVVVGIDGSRNSEVALGWAAEYARLIGAEVRAVIAWQGPMGFAFARLSTPDFEREARNVVRRVIRSVLGSSPSVTVVTDVVYGNPTTVLVDASRGAELLVVGERGYGGFTGMLLGSVGAHCVRNAHCSVVVVRGNRHKLEDVSARGMASART